MTGSANFPAEVAAAAQAAQRKWLVPASVTMAQWALESGYGKHTPPGSNNPFGIKALKGQKSVTVPTREVVRGKSVIISAAFRQYASLSDAFDDHGRLLATASVYSSAMAAWDRPPYDLARGVRLMGAHYATAPDYATLLLSIIHGQNLQRFDA